MLKHRSQRLRMESFLSGCQQPSKDITHLLLGLFRRKKRIHQRSPRMRDRRIAELEWTQGSTVTMMQAKIAPKQNWISNLTSTSVNLDLLPTFFSWYFSGSMPHFAHMFFSMSAGNTMSPRRSQYSMSPSSSPAFWKKTPARTRSVLTPGPKYGILWAYQLVNLTLRK